MNWIVRSNAPKELQRALLGVDLNAPAGQSPHLLEVMRQTKTHVAYGIDDGACAVFNGDRFDHSIGSHVHRLEGANFETEQYDVFKYAS